MHEPLLERIQVLENSVQRWKLISLALLILLICGTAISGTFGAILMLSGPGMREVEVMRMEEARARMDAERAREEVERLRRIEQLQQKDEAKAAPPVEP
jgi:hypothetical protein